MKAVQSTVRFFLVTLFLSCLGLLVACTTPSPQNGPATIQSRQRPLIIGHRGASGHLPEHTLASYELAARQGADYIEPDLVSTKDGVLIARHENEISETTDVAVKFPKRKKKKTVDGQTIEGWFTEDFTWAEIQTLRAKERLPFRNQKENFKHSIPSFEQVLALRERLSKELGRQIGIYPETKHPTYHDSIGLSLEEKLVAALKAAGLDTADAPVFIQSFETANLKELRTKTKARLLLLIGEPNEIPPDVAATGGTTTYLQLMTPDGLKAIRAYADGIGPYKRYIVPENKDGSLMAPTPLIEAAHAVGLLVHPYTFRSDPKYLAKEYAGDPSQEYIQFFNLGVDGVFTDFPDHGVRAREKWMK